MKRILAVATLVTSVAANAIAQKPAPIELGFKPERVYEFGSIDHVNVFNGNVLVTVPIGLTFPVSSHLQYGLKLVYNSKMWDYKYVQAAPEEPIYYWARPNIRSNAGTGWRMTMGRLLPPHDWTVGQYREEDRTWTYEGPSGDEHTLSNTTYSPPGTPVDSDAAILFTHDGSHLRMVKVNASRRKVEFPDGTFHTFDLCRGDWWLTEISDRFANKVSITYEPTISTPLECDDDPVAVAEWRITDVHSREHRVYFQVLPELADSRDRGMVVDRIHFNYPSGPQYDLSYDTHQIPFGPHHSVPASFPDGPGSAPTTPVPVLSTISIPDGTSYHFSYNLTDAGGHSQGMLKVLTLPTLGKIEYTYQSFDLPSEDPCTPFGPRNSSPGVLTRTLNGDTWTYGQSLGPPVTWNQNTTPVPPCDTGEPDSRNLPAHPQRWARTTVLSPPDPILLETDPTRARSRTDHYFHVYARVHGLPPDDLGADTPNISFAEPVVKAWPGVEKGRLSDPLAIEDAEDEGAEDSTDESTQRYLATQTWSACDGEGECVASSLLRSTYRRYEDVQASRRPRSERTVLHDDTTGCGGSVCYAQTDFSGDDRAGHYRTSTLTTNRISSGVTGETRTTEYPELSNATAMSLLVPWVHTNYTETSRTVGSHVAKRMFNFSATGLLLNERTLAGTGPGDHDVATVYSHTAGNVTDEMTYGGDLQSLSDPQLVPQYRNRYAWQNGVLKSIQHLTAAGAELSFKSAEYTDQPSTGLISQSKGSDGLATTYTYDALGRLETVSPPGEATMTYQYVPATQTANPRVTATREGTTTAYEFDRLGRLIRTERPVPGSGCTEQITEYDDPGRKWKTSVWKTCGSAANVSETRYDALGRPTKVISPDGSESSTSYVGDRLVLRTRSINSPAVDVTTGEEYDALGRLSSVTEEFGTPGAQTTTYKYDAADRLISVEMPSGAGTQTRTFGYDGRGFLFSETHPELGVNGDGTSTYQYDARGHVRQKTTGGTILNFAYDAAERLTSITHGTRPLKQFVYDEIAGHNQCLTTTLCRGKLVGAARFHYDPDLGHPFTQQLAVTESYHFDPSTGKVRDWELHVEEIPGRFTRADFTYSQSYNSLGLVASAAYPCPLSWSCRHMTNSYTDGRLTSLEDSYPNATPPWHRHLADLSYQPSGATQTVTHTSGVLDSWTPDPSGLARPGGITATRNGVQLWKTGAYSYDGSGNVIRVGDDRHTTYRYDPFGRLTAWTDQWPDGSFSEVGQGYDAYGNKLFNTYRRCNSSNVCATTSMLAVPIVGTTNHYAGFQYDSAGNVVVDRWKGVPTGQGGVTGVPSRTYSWDALGMMTRLDDDQIKLRFLYTPADERIAAIERITGTNGITRNKVTYTLRNLDHQLLSVFTMAPGSTSLAWKEDELWRGAALLGRVSMTDTYHFALDHLGSPRKITNSVGNPVGGGAVQEFAPFGAGGTSDGGALQFTAHERDAANLAAGAVGIPDYFHARYYDADWGRFLSVDPIVDIKTNLRNPQGWNRYAYVRNNPLRFVDPTGKYTCSASKDDCKAIEKSIQDLRTTASMALAAGKPEALRLLNAVAFFGKAGQRNGVTVTTGKLVGKGETSQRGLGTFLRVTVTLDRDHLLSGRTSIEGRTDVANTLAHEAGHGIVARRNSWDLFESREERKQTELEGFRYGSSVNAVMGLDSTDRIWTNFHGWDLRRLEEMAEEATTRAFGPPEN